MDTGHTIVGYFLVDYENVETAGEEDDADHFNSVQASTYCIAVTLADYVY